MSTDTHVTEPTEAMVAEADALAAIKEVAKSLRRTVGGTYADRLEAAAETLGRHLASAEAENAALRADVERKDKALVFYADEKNWIDTPPWEEDLENITAKAIPVIRSWMEGTSCDCGDTARAALSNSKEPGK